jgi:cyclophilin family peptidyl-prolyl cis-trans isomerase
MDGHPEAMRTSDVSSARRGLGLLLVVLLAAAAPVVAQPKAARQAVITLDKGGEIVIELFPADAPGHVKNFAQLAGQGFYDGLRFHRVEPWVVQVGDPQSKTLPMDHPRMGTGGPGYTIKAEFNRRPHERGAVGMARVEDPDSAGSQFYIVLKPARGLDGQYTVFGRVIGGLEVVDGLRRGDRIKSVKVTP